MTDALKRLSDEGVAIWLDDLSRKRITSGNLAELIDQQHVVGVTTNPSIFQKAISVGRRLRAAARRPRRPQGHRRGSRPHDHHGGRPGRRRHPAPGLRRHRRPGRPGLHRGRPAPGARHHRRPSPRPSSWPGWWTARTRFIKIPATKAGLPGDHRGHRPGHQRQRHADLLAGALPRGHGRLPGGPGEGQGRGPGPVHDPLGGVVLRLPRGHRDRQAPGRSSAPTRPRRSRARPRWPTPGSPTRRTRRSSPPTAGPPSTRPAPTSSARCGPRPASRTRPTRTPCTSTSWSPRARSTPCRRPPWRPPPTTARSPATPCAARTTQARADLDGARQARHLLRRRRPGAGGRGRGEVRGVLERPAQVHRGGAQAPRSLGGVSSLV